LFKKILIIARGGLGNVLMFTPALRLLKKRFCSAEIYILVLSGGLQEILSENQDIKEVIIYDQKVKGPISLFKYILTIRRQHFDLAIVIYPVGLKSSFLAFVSGASIRIGFKIPLLKNIGSLLFTHLIIPKNELHYVEQNLRILEVLGINYQKDSSNISLYIPDNIKITAKDHIVSCGVENGDKIIGIHPGSIADQKWKRWPIRYYSELINMIRSEWDPFVFIFGDPSEEHLINNIFAAVKNSNKVIKVTDKILMETAALIGLCNAFIGNDSGLMHIAVATDVPTFCIAGPTDVKKTGPYGPNTYIVHSDLDCLFCYNFNTVNFSCPLNIDYQTWLYRLSPPYEK